MAIKSRSDSRCARKRKPAVAPIAGSRLIRMPKTCLDRRRNAATGHRGPAKVERLARAHERDPERADELDGDRDTKRDARDRLIEAQIHRRDDQPKEDDGPPLPGVESRPSWPRDGQQDA